MVFDFITKGKENLNFLAGGRGDSKGEGNSFSRGGEGG